jgi:hypothetical protein
MDLVDIVSKIDNDRLKKQQLTLNLKVLRIKIFVYLDNYEKEHIQSYVSQIQPSPHNLD